MTDFDYILSSLTWAVYGLLVGLMLGLIARLVVDMNRR